jgi:hypothetical protein
MTPGLKARGWTDTLIRRFLPSPDATRPNVHYLSGPPVRLYLLARVEAIEATAEFLAARSAAATRKASAARAVETKRAAMRRHVEGLVVEVVRMGDEELVRRACKHYNRRQEERAERRAERGQECDYDWRPATPASDRAFLDRITVNRSA